MRVGSFSADPGQFPFRWVERAGNYLSVRKMADEPCNHQNHQFVADKLKLSGNRSAIRSRNFEYILTTSLLKSIF